MRRRKPCARSREAIEAYKFNDAANGLYRFVWNIYCDWYLELVKPVLGGPDGAAKTETRAMVAWVRDEIVKMLHPFMPFVTEELWRVTAEQGPAREGLLALAPWPQHTRLSDHAAEAEIGWVIDIVTAIRSLRAEMNLTVATELPVVLAGVSAETDARAGRWADMIRRLARLSSLSVAKAVPPGSIQLVVRGEVVALPLKGVIDFAAEEARLGKELGRVDSDIARVDAKLNNPKFMQNARRGSRRGSAREARGGGRPPRQDSGGAGAAQGGGVVVSTWGKPCGASCGGWHGRSALSSPRSSSRRSRRCAPAMPASIRRDPALRGSRSSSSPISIIPA